VVALFIEVNTFVKDCGVNRVLNDRCIIGEFVTNLSILSADQYLTSMIRKKSGEANMK
jgi:hypothetical protein